MLGILVSGFLSFTSWEQLIDRLSNSCYYILLKKKKERKKQRPLKNKTTLCSNCCGVLLWTKEVLTLSMQCLWVGYSLSIGSCFSSPLSCYRTPFNSALCPSFSSNHLCEFLIHFAIVERISRAYSSMTLSHEFLNLILYNFNTVYFLWWSRYDR